MKKSKLKKALSQKELTKKLRDKISDKEFYKLRSTYVHAKDEQTRIDLRNKYPELCNDNEIGLSTVFSERNLFGDQLVILNNGKSLCRLTLMLHSKQDHLGIGINDDGSGIRFKLVNGTGKWRAEQYLVPIYPKKK